MEVSYKFIKRKEARNAVIEEEQTELTTIWDKDFSVIKASTV